MTTHSSFRTAALVSVVAISVFLVIIAYSFIRMTGFQFFVGGGTPILEPTGTSSYLAITYAGVSTLYPEKDLSTPRSLLIYPQNLRSINVTLTSKDGDVLKLNGITFEEFERWRR